MMDIRSLARALGGEVSRNQVLAPAMGHSRRDRSLSVRLDPRAPGGFLVHLFGSGDLFAEKDRIRDLMGLRDRGAQLAPPRDVAPEPTDAERVRKAIALWDAARSDLRGTPIEVYFTRPKRDGGRGLMVPYDIAGDVLRYHPALPWKDDQTGEFLEVPAMLAARRCIHTDQLKAVHCTRLTEDGYKVDRRNRGPARGTAIKIDADEMVSHGLGLAEGIETALSARQLGWRPMWAAGSAGAIETFPVLSGIECLTLHAENDENGANERAIHECASRWHAADREVIVVEPKAGKDLNDALGGITNA